MKNVAISIPLPLNQAVLNVGKNMMIFCPECDSRALRDVKDKFKCTRSVCGKVFKVKVHDKSWEY